MRRGFVVMVAVCGSWSAAFAQTAREVRLPAGMVTIDGSTNPAGLPDYLVWASVFRMLSKFSGFPRDFLPMTEAERALVLETAMRSAAAEEATWDRQRARLAEMQRAGLDDAAIKKALYDIGFEQRLSTLAEREALLKQLSAEARAALKGFVDDSRLGMASSVPAADLDAYRKPAQEPSTRFTFYDNRWLNLHHLLRASARGGLAPAGLSDEDARTWAAGVDFYKRYADRDLLFDDGMVEIKTALRGAVQQPTLDGIILDAGVKATLERLMPIYNKPWSAGCTHRNREWIAAVRVLLERHETALAAVLARTYDTAWPRERIPVDVTMTAGPNGAYTTGPPTHVTISSSEESLQGPAALEMLFHESSHSDLSNLFQRVQQAAAAQHVEVPRQLWHAVLFYTAGELTRRELAAHGIAYREYADERLYANLCGAGCRAKIAEHWGPRLDGTRSVSDSLSALVAAFK